VLIAASIAMLGPGAYSVDGYLFGRREIVIPPRGPESQS
jgi:guanyl-specific ribonuclease Sa